MYISFFDCEWGRDKAEINWRKHAVLFDGAAGALYDPLRARGLTRIRMKSGRVVVVAWTPRGRRTRLISARMAPPSGGSIRSDRMRKEYDFSKAIRGPVIPLPPGKTRITIRIDDDILDWFRAKVNAAGGGSYQAMINEALRHTVELDGEDLETVVRRAVRKELRQDRRPRRRGRR